MKKIIFTLLLMFMPLTLVKANFEEMPEPTLPPSYGGGWIGQYRCVDDSVSFNEFQALGGFQVPYDNEESNIINDGYGYCVRTDIVGRIHDYNSSLGGKQIIYCEPGEVVGRRGTSPTEFTKYAHFIATWNKGVCCPADQPFNYEDPFFLSNWNHLRCCSRAHLDGVSSSSCGSFERGEEPIDYEQDTAGDTSVFPTGIPVFTCATQNCFVGPSDPSNPSSDQIFLSGVSRGTYTEDEVGNKGYICYEEADTGDFDNPGVTPSPVINVGGVDYYCIGGSGVPVSDWDANKDRLPAYLACRSFLSPERPEETAEYDNCLLCINACETCVYSSLGCIDTTLNGVITTIMRIGLGVLGALGIFRIMQAAMLRQSADPKDIQESWDIIMSVIMGAIVLVASSLILRVIGVNILGILPFDF